MVVAHNIQLETLQYFHLLHQLVVDQVGEKADIAQLMRVGLVAQVGVLLLKTAHEQAGRQVKETLAVKP